MDRSRDGKAQAMLRGVLLGLGVSLLVLAAGCFLAAVFIHLGKLSEGAMRYCAWAVCTLSAIAGSVTAQRSAGRARLIVSLVCALLLVVFLLAVRAFLPGAGKAQWQGAVIVCACAVAAALAQAGRGKGRR